MTRRLILIPLLIATVLTSASAASAQDKGTVEPKPLPPLANPNDPRIGAKELFGRKVLPAAMPTRVLGFYAHGCIAGAEGLPINGDTWQVMRLSRNRFFAHPDMVALVKRLSEKAHKDAGWPGILVGDMSQPRGGPMFTGHASHQVGLDADIWLTPMPDRILTDREREDISATLVVKDRKTMNYKVWTESHARLIKRAASYKEVERVFVHPPIKAELCKWATGDRSWLAKVRPIFGHNYHFHIRMKCPEGSAGCKPQGAPHPKDGTGCGEELAYWMGPEPWTPKKRDPNAKPYKPPPPLTLSGLPVDCRSVVSAE